MPTQQNNPITKKEEVAANPDNKIDEDFKGYPNGPATDKTIQPVTPDEEKTADLDNKDGEKKIIPPAERKGLDEK